MMCLLSGLIIINFLFALQTEHASARQKLLDDKWLLEQCGEPDFYMHLKQHTDLCENVEANARRNILLHSVTSALQKTKLCGFDSCETLAIKFVDTLMRGGVFMLSCLIILLVAVPCMIVILYRNFVEKIAEVCAHPPLSAFDNYKSFLLRIDFKFWRHLQDHLRTKYNMPYGLNTSLLHSEAFNTTQAANFRQRVGFSHFVPESPHQSNHHYSLISDLEHEI